MIPVLQIGKLSFREVKHTIQYLNKEETGGAGTRIQLVILLFHYTFFSLVVSEREWGRGECCTLWRKARC